MDYIELEMLNTVYIYIVSISPWLECGLWLISLGGDVINAARNCGLAINGKASDGVYCSVYFREVCDEINA